MPRLKLKPVLREIQAKNKNQKDIQNLKIPEMLGGEVDMILGLQFARVHPKPLFTLDNGLTIYKSQFIPANPEELACIGGPINVLESIVTSVGARTAGGT